MALSGVGGMARFDDEFFTPEILVGSEDSPWGRAFGAWERRQPGTALPQAASRIRIAMVPSVKVVRLDLGPDVLASACTRSAFTDTAPL